MSQTLVLAITLLVAATCASAQNVRCYVCNSADEGQEACRDSSNLPVEYIQPCLPLVEGLFKGREAIGCRKTIQNVGDDQSIIRECAYTGEDVSGQRKTGNWRIKLFYNQCTNTDLTNDKPCNGVPSVGFFLPTVLVALLSFVFVTYN